MVILLLSNKWDISLDYVVQILKRRSILYIRINTEDISERKTTFSFPRDTFTLDNKLGIGNLNGMITSILLRRPGKPYEFLKKSKPPEPIVNYIVQQWHAFLSGLQSIPNILWMNNPIKNAFAEIKINQLHIAKKIGFKIPLTCITNDIDALRSFWNQCDGRIIAKALNTPLIKEKNREFFIFTNRIKSIESIKDDEIKISPTIFQKALMPKVDYRITVVGENCIAAKTVITKNHNQIDWRRISTGIKFTKAEIPQDIEKKCIKLVTRLGLKFGAIDLVQYNDSFYFLEVNPSGEWGWLQKTAKLPIAEMIVDTLVRGKK